MFSTYAFAEENKDQKGKMHLKTERISESQKEELKQEDYKETELDKIAPDLFNEQNRAVIESKKKEIQEYKGNLKDRLFMTTSSKKITTEDMRWGLFPNKYSIEEGTVTAQNKTIKSEEKAMSIGKLVPLFALVFMILIGIYLMMRKMFG